jgi:hypothetical protein
LDWVFTPRVFTPDEKIDSSRREGWLRGWRNRWVMARRIGALEAGRP